MSEKLNCNVVRDLLPSYIDGLVSEETRTEIDSHLETCESCTNVLSGMKEPPVKETEAKQIDYLKKTRKRSALVTLACVAGAVVMAVCAMLVWFRIGNTSRNFDIDSLIYDISVYDNDAYIVVDLAESFRGTKIKANDENGVLYLDVTASPGGSARSELSYTASEPIKEVWIGDHIVWSDGTLLDYTTAKLYHAKNPYIGNISADLRIAELLGVQYDLGPFTNELNTSEEPYGWTIILSESISKENEEAAQKIMQRDTQIFSALIENLGYVDWKYTVPGEGERVFRGDVFYEIQQTGKSPSLFAKLVKELGISGQRITEAFGEKEFYISIELAFDDPEIYSLGIAHYLGGEMVSSGGMMNADESRISSKEKTIIIVSGEDVCGPNAPVSAFEISDYAFELTLYDKEEKVIAELPMTRINAAYGRTYSYVVTVKDGKFTIAPKTAK